MTTRQAILLPVDITSLQPCNCAPAYKDRGRIDDQCWYHRAVEVVEILTEGATVIELTEPAITVRGNGGRVTMPHNWLDWSLKDGKYALALVEEDSE